MAQLAAITSSDFATIVRSIVVTVDDFDDGIVRGWAVDLNDPSVPVKFELVIDGHVVLNGHCDKRRNDVQEAGFGTEAAGFQISLPPGMVDGHDHEAKFRTPNGDWLQVRRDGLVAAFVTFRAHKRTRIDGSVDGMIHGAIRGWLHVLGDDDARTGGSHILVSCDGEKIGQVRADRSRPDVAQVKGGDLYCGFAFDPPQYLRRGPVRHFHFHLLPDLVELPRSPYITSFIADDMVAQLGSAIEKTEHLQTELSTLRNQLQKMIPQQHQSLPTYDRWARSYLPLLRNAVEASRLQFSTEYGKISCLVSILMPAYCPQMHHFVAAVESVVAQTYTEWELIIVDDGSASLELTEQMNAFSARDRRIKIHHRKRNQGISNATNAGLRAAKGECICSTSPASWRERGCARGGLT